MEVVSIATQNHIDKLRQCFAQELPLLAGDGINIALTEKTKGKLKFLAFDLPETVVPGDRDLKLVIRRWIAQVLARAIVHDMQKALTLTILRERYKTFDDTELAQIADDTVRMLQEQEDTPAEEQVNEIAGKLLDYLNANNELVLEGFIRFRLKDYYAGLRSAVDRAVDNFMVEREYKEFIRLLKYFVDIQEPKFDEVHVIMRPNGVFRLLDSKYRVIENDYLEGFIADLGSDDVDYEDLLISALITVAPARVVLHFDRNRAVVETIVGVFEDKVTMCPGCPLCSSKANSRGRLDNI
ncbi:MAG TPA: putative sporulation protein YtxC [Firmicutes bacterium]|nr:putative sporulation protein YtxC [Bacillota bacterium]